MNQEEKTVNNSQPSNNDPQKKEKFDIPENGSIMDHKNLQAKFLRSTMLYLSLLHIIMAGLTIYFCFNRRAFKDFYRNYTNIEDGYAIFFLVFIALLLLYPLFLKDFARKIQILNMLLLAVCVAFLVSFSLNYGYKVRNNYHDKIASIFMAIYSSTFGVTIMNLIKGEKINYTIAVSIGSVFYLGQEILNVYVFKLHNPQLWIYGLWLLAQILITMYILIDQEMMITRRKDFYQENDGFLGMIHLHTDWAFRFWKDLFTKDPNNDAIDVQESMQNDRQTPIIRFDDGLDTNYPEEKEGGFDAGEDSARKPDPNLNQTQETQAL